MHHDAAPPAFVSMTPQRSQPPQPYTRPSHCHAHSCSVSVDRPFSQQQQALILSSLLDSMRWFSYWRSPSPPWRRNGVVCYCLLPTAYGARRTMHCQWGWVRGFSFFVPGDLDLWFLTLTFELGRDFCTMHLTTKFNHPTFSRSAVIVRTNTLTNWQTNRRRWKHRPRFAMLRRWVNGTFRR